MAFLAIGFIFNGRPLFLQESFWIQAYVDLRRQVSLCQEVSCVIFFNNLYLEAKVLRLGGKCLLFLGNCFYLGWLIILLNNLLFLFFGLDFLLHLFFHHSSNNFLFSFSLLFWNFIIWLLFNNRDDCFLFNNGRDRLNYLWLLFNFYFFWRLFRLFTFPLYLFLWIINQWSRL